MAEAFRYARDIQKIFSEISKCRQTEAEAPAGLKPPAMLGDNYYRNIPYGKGPIDKFSN